MLGRARRDAKAVAGGLRAAVSRPGQPVRATAEGWEFQPQGTQTTQGIQCQDARTGEDCPQMTRLMRLKADG